MKIGEHEFTVDQLTESFQLEDNKADYEALRGSELFKSEITQEGVSAYLETDAGKQFLQPKLDAYHTKGLQSHLEKNKDKYKSVEDYQALQEELNNSKADYDKKIEAMQLNSSIRTELLKAGVKPNYLDMVVNSIDKSGLVVKEGKLIGAAELIAGAKESYSDLFGKTTGINNVPAGGGNPPQGGESYSREELNKMTDAEYFALKEKNKK